MLKRFCVVSFHKNKQYEKRTIKQLHNIYRDKNNNKTYYYSSSVMHLI